LEEKNSVTRRLTNALLACTLAFSVTATHAAAINYAATAGSNIVLDATDDCGTAGSVGCFSFTPNATDSSSATSLTITSGTANGVLGRIDGTFGVGTIISSGGLETAPVTGVGSLSLFDGANALTASLSWVDIAPFGTGGIINIEGTANLTGISYSGSNADLLAFSSAGSGTQTATFQFTSPTSLSDLFNGSGTTTTSFSGSITPVPVPAALWLFGSGLLGFTMVGRRQRQ